MRFVLLPVVIALLVSPALHAQETRPIVVDTTTTQDGGWDTPAVTQLMALAATRRSAPLADTALHNYRGAADGFLYFYGDRPSTSGRYLVRVNQMGLELYWRQPGTWRQRIVGLRSASPIPNGMRFHLDHFTMVQNGFGNVIRIGGGDEVKDVVHPAAPNASATYHFRLADSLEMQIENGQRIRVYEVQVRPRDMQHAAMVGTVYLDKESGAVVRMTFTFTPAAYVDGDIDYINISLDNSLYARKYWLPSEQIVEIRRALPVLDIGLGGVIRSRIRVRDYELNAQISDSIFRAPPIARARRGTTYKFDGDIYDGLEEAGLRQPPALSELRAEAEEIVRNELMSGLPPVRAYAPDIPSLMHYNRAEGLFAGAGVAYTPNALARYDVFAGYALGTDRPAARVRALRNVNDTRVVLEAYLRDTNDLQPAHPGRSLWNSVSAALSADDYLDLWYSTGLRLSFARDVSADYTIALRASLEEQRSATLEKHRAMLNRGASFRPVLPIDDGTSLATTLSITRLLEQGVRFAWGGALDGTLGSIEGISYATSSVSASVAWFNASRNTDLGIHALAGVTSTRSVAQQLFLVGGHGTLPGYDYRSFGGRRMGMVRAELTRDVVGRWAGIRVIGGVGATGGLAGTSATDTHAWLVHPTDGIRASAGVGASLLWRMLHVDVVRGLNEGHWQLDISGRGM